MQLTLDIPVTLPKDAYNYGTRVDGGTHGVVLTKPHIVELILDLAGYRPTEDLTQRRLLEPSCGHGAFLVPAVERLLVATRQKRVRPEALRDAISAFDIEDEHVEQTREAVVERLVRDDVSRRTARALAESWIRQGDFLLARIKSGFDFVVGNPPYIRIEQLSPELQAEYRRRYATLFDRADLYVAFIERSLGVLSEGGILSFICADRWTLNRYGAPLRQMITQRFRVDCYVDLHTASPFESDVIAYPSIFVIARGGTGPVNVVSVAGASPEECAHVRPAIGDPDTSFPGVTVSRHKMWFKDDEPWVLGSPESLDVLRDLESRFKPIESGSATKVGIGVATGCDDVYIVDATADIEPDRLVPLVMRDDIEHGAIRDAKRFVINAFQDDGAVVDLERYPRLASYLDAHASQIRRRHVAQKNPSAWFRTIDRVYPQLVGRPKLLIPDIAGSNEVAFDEGRFHPHHNLYYVASDTWDMEVLGGLLSSKVALFFVWSYAVKMRGGYLRFQAQYLRRIRLPSPKDIPVKLAKSICDAFRKRDFARLDELALAAYRISALPDFDFVDTRH